MKFQKSINSNPFLVYKESIFLKGNISNIQESTAYDIKTSRDFCLDLTNVNVLLHKKKKKKENMQLNTLCKPQACSSQFLL